MSRYGALGSLGPQRGPPRRRRHFGATEPRRPTPRTPENAVGVVREVSLLLRREGRYSISPDEQSRGGPPNTLSGGPRPRDAWPDAMTGTSTSPTTGWSNVYGNTAAAGSSSAAGLGFVLEPLLAP